MTDNTKDWVEETLDAEAENINDAFFSANSTLDEEQKSVLRLLMTQAYNRGILASEAAVPGERNLSVHFKGEKVHAVENDWNDCRSQTLQNLQALRLK